MQKRGKQRSYYYHRDHQGSITHLTDEEGEIVETFTYDAYGTILSHTQTAQTMNPYAYTGREFEGDGVSVLYYYRARYYDPRVGRFISQDPIEFMAGDVNFYRYVGGDPVNFVDPSGFNAGPIYLPGPIPKIDMKSGNTTVDNTILGACNTALNTVNSFLNAGLNAMAGVGDAMEPYDGAIISVSTGLGPQASGIGGMISKSGSVLRTVGRLGKARKVEKACEKIKPPPGFKVAKQFEKNKKKGKEFEKEGTNDLKKRANDVENEVTIKTESGTKTRVDAIGIDKKSGKITIEEYKSSSTAPLTRNQKIAFPELEKSGDTVVGKGKGTFPGGTTIPPTKVNIKRPK